MKVVGYIGIILLVIGCNSTSDNSAVLTKEDLVLAEPFIVEHYEFISNQDTAIKLFLNREIDLVDFPGIQIKVFFDNSNDFCYAYIPFTTKSKNRTINIPLRKIDQSNPNQAGNLDIRKAIQDHINGKHLIGEICFAHGTSNVGYERFRDNSWTLNTRTLKKFSAKSFKKGRRYDKFFNTYRWSSCRFQFYKGKFDNQGRKQGDWIWYFSNKKPMLEAQFINDTLVDGMNSVTMYNFLGDTVRKYFY